MYDLRVVLRLRRQQLGDAAIYWLRVLGYEPGSRTLTERMYGVYLAVFGAGWVVAMAAFALQSAAQLGGALPPLAFDAIRAGLPWLVLAGQVLVACGALRSSPLKLTYPDMAYLVGSPLSRGALVLVAWGLAALRTVAIALVAAGLVAVALAQGMAPQAVVPSALAAVSVALPLVALTVGLVWCLGLAHVAARGRGRGWRLAWLAPVALLPLAGVLPDALLWPGRALALAAAGQAQGHWAAGLWLAALASVALVAWLGSRVPTAEVARQSETYARIQALGMMGPWMAPDVVRGIRRQAALAGRKPFLRLPRVGGAWALAARTGLAFARQPASLLSLLVWGGLIATAASWIVTGAGYPPQWAAWLAMAMFSPPGALGAGLQADAGDAFLRQFLPQDNLHLLAADMALPAFVLTLTALALWLVQRPAPGVAFAGALAVVVLAGLMALCRGVGLLRVGALGRPLPYAAVAGIALGATILASTELHAPLAALGVAAAVALALLALIRRSSRIAAL